MGINDVANTKLVILNGYVSLHIYIEMVWSKTHLLH